MSVDMDVVGVMAAYLPVVRVCIVQSREALSASLDRAVPTTSLSTDMIEQLL